MFATVRGYLLAQGLPPAQVNDLLANPQLHFEAGLMARMLARPEKPRDYAQFLTPATIAPAQAFARRHADTLAAVERRTQCPPSVVVAILAIESGLGTYTGKWQAFKVLASQAILDTPQAQAQLARHWPADQRATLAKPEFHERLRKRAAWARQELMALIKLSRQWGVSPWAVMSSPAGALGMSQFMPTSIQNWGADGDGDGRVDLTQAVDAMYSVGNYLHAHGWRRGLSREAQAKVVYTYNHSQPYVDTVLELARRIGVPPKP
jgi:membrane-bound lytic murein transglycosylase B